jgi:hypothetical protein
MRRKVRCHKGAVEIHEDQNLKGLALVESPSRVDTADYGTVMASALTSCCSRSAPLRALGWHLLI